MMKQQTARKVARGELASGDALGVARVAAVTAAKRASDFVPLAPVSTLVGLEVRTAVDEAMGVITVEVEAFSDDQGALEVQALTGVMAACLSIYDLARASDPDITITNIMLLEKDGGLSGEYTRPMI